MVNVHCKEIIPHHTAAENRYLRMPLCALMPQIYTFYADLENGRTAALEAQLSGMKKAHDAVAGIAEIIFKYDGLKFPIRGRENDSLWQPIDSELSVTLESDVRQRFQVAKIFTNGEIVQG